MKVVDLIEAAKDKAGSLKDVAAKIGRTPTNISEWKSGRVKPKASDIAAMAQIAGLPVLITLAMVEAELEPETKPIWEKALGEVNARLSPGNMALIR